MIEAIQARLRDTGVLKLVAGSIDFETAANARPNALPAAYVLPLDEKPSPNELGCGVAQMVIVSFGIAWAVSNVADAKGGAALNDLDDLRKSGQTALLGWSPAEDAFPMEFGGGALLGFKNGVLWWQDIYVTQHLIKA